MVPRCSLIAVCDTLNTLYLLTYLLLLHEKDNMLKLKGSDLVYQNGLDLNQLTD